MPFFVPNACTFWKKPLNVQLTLSIEGLRERTEHLDIFLFPPIIQWCSISNVLFTGGRGESDFSVLKYY